MTFGLEELRRLVDLLAREQVPMKSDFHAVANRREGTILGAYELAPGVWLPSEKSEPATAAELALRIDYALDRANVNKQLRSREDAKKRLARAKMIAQNATQMIDGLKQLGIDKPDFSDGLRRELILAKRAATKLVRRLDGRAIVPMAFPPDEASARALMNIAAKYVVDKPGAPRGATLAMRKKFVALVLEVAGLHVQDEALRKRLTPRSKHSSGQKQ